MEVEEESGAGRKGGEEERRKKVGEGEKRKEREEGGRREKRKLVLKTCKLWNETVVMEIQVYLPV